MTEIAIHNQQATIGILGFSCKCGEPIHSGKTEVYDCPKCGRQYAVSIDGGGGHLVIQTQIIAYDPEQMEAEA